MLLMLADDFSGIGTVEDKIVTDKREFVLSLKTELSAMSGAVTYKIKSVSCEEIAKDVDEGYIEQTTLKKWLKYIKDEKMK